MSLEEDLRQQLSQLTGKGDVRALRVLADRASNIGSELGTVIALRAHGLADENQGKNEAALEKHQTAFEISERIGDLSEQFSAALNLGNVYKKRGSNDESTLWYQRAVDISDALKFPLARIKSRMNLAMRYQLENNLDTRRAELERCLELAVAEDLVEQRAMLLGNLSSIDFQQGDTDRAISKLRQSIELFHAVGADAEVARSKGNLAVYCRRIGAIDEAMSLYNEVIDEWYKLDDKRFLASSYANLANLFRHINQSREALINYHKAMDIAVETENVMTQAIIHRGIAQVYAEQGDIAVAFEYYNRALDLYRRCNDEIRVSEVILNIAVLHSRNGDQERAIELLESIRPEFERRQNVVALGHYHLSIGAAYARSGDRTSLFEHNQKALSHFSVAKDAEGIALALANLSESAIDDSNTEVASKYLDQLQSLSSITSRTRAQIETLRGRIALKNADLSNAQLLAENALQNADEHKLLAERIMALDLLCDVAVARNDLRAYLEFNAIRTELHQKVQSSETARKIATLEVERTIAVERKEREKERELLYSAVPQSIADRMLKGEPVNDAFDNAAVMFIDIVDFTRFSESLTPNEVVMVLEHTFAAFDTICDQYGVMKIKTIGDGYLAVAFPNDGVGTCEHRLALAACDMLRSQRNDLSDLQFRIGLHSGPVTAGVIGAGRKQYDVWGDTVNVASRMESTGEADRIHVTEYFAQKVMNGPWHLSLRGDVPVKGKGTMTTYWLEEQYEYPIAQTAH